VEKMLALDFVGGKLTDSEYSHKNGWAMLRACQLSDALGEEVKVLRGESWDNYDKVFLYHGMEFQGSLNLFGGATEESAKFYERIATTKTKLISLDIDMPDYGELCKGRLKACDDYWRNIDWDAVSTKCKTIGSVTHPFESDALVIGDSHAFSVYQRGYNVIRKDARTLCGVLKKTIRKEIMDHGIDPGTINTLTTYYGNIDIRHHLMREANPAAAIDELITEYEKQLKELNIEEIEVVCPLPIEHESRRLPKTGYFEGTPFYGSQEARSQLVDYMGGKIIEMCINNGWRVYEWPIDWYMVSPLAFMQTYMERPKSVHLAPKFHRWNYWKNEPNVIETNTSLDSFFE
jgi:hypothetical protein